MFYDRSCKMTLISNRIKLKNIVIAFIGGVKKISSM